MKKYRCYILWYLIFLLGINGVFGYIFQKNFKGFNDFLNSNLFQTLITFSVGALGVLALVIYEKQQSDKKSDIAKLILIEIQSAEQKISSFQALGEITLDNKGSIYSFINILESNNWSNNRNLFLSEFDTDDFAVLNSFYEHAEKLNRSVTKMHDIKKVGEIEKAKQLQTLRKDIFLKVMSEENFQELYQNYSSRGDSLFHQEIYWFESFIPLQEFATSLKTIRPIRSTITAEKLKKIAKQ